VERKPVAVPVTEGPIVPEEPRAEAEERLKTLADQEGDNVNEIQVDGLDNQQGKYRYNILLRFIKEALVNS